MLLKLLKRDRCARVGDAPDLVLLGCEHPPELSGGLRADEVSLHLVGLLPCVEVQTLADGSLVLELCHLSLFGVICC